MLILSKYKDYYDYLSGIYGIDEKIVLDRRNFHNVIVKDYTRGEEKRKLKFYICGVIFETLIVDGKFYWGEDLKRFQVKKEKDKWHRAYFTKAQKENLVCFDDSDRTQENRYVSMIPYIDEDKHNQKQECAIMSESTWSFGSFNKYPILEQFGITKILPAHDIYMMLVAWLTPREIEPPKQTDNEKILSAGFDLKESFRGKGWKTK